MPKRKMLVIPKPAEETRTVFVTDKKDAGFVYFEGDGTFDYVCGGCDRKLAKKMPQADSLQDIVLLCPTCGAYNDSVDKPLS